MFVVQSSHFQMQPFRPRAADKPEERPSVHIPTVYEKIIPEPVRWEYHVLTIDAREQPLPDADQLNALGKEGWVLAGMLDERATGRGGLVYYYFVRQAQV